MEEKGTHLALNEMFGHPDTVWEKIQKDNVPLSGKVHMESWEDITEGKVDTLSIGHVLAAKFIAYSKPIPGKIKDKVVIGADKSVRDELNLWNREVGHINRVVPFGDMRIRKPFRALAESIAKPYLDTSSKEYDSKIENLALTLYEIGVNFTTDKLHTEQDK